jgi:hypothetical protein
LEDFQTIQGVASWVTRVESGAAVHVTEPAVPGGWMKVQLIRLYVAGATAGAR